MNRRQFLEFSSAAVGAVRTTLFGARSDASAQANARTFGIQVGAVSFLDEGTDKVLDGFAEMANINTVFLATFT